MLSDVAFGQYYPASSPIHRLDPRTKIVVLIAYIVMIFLIKNFVGFLLAGGFLLATIIIAKVPIGAVIKSVKAILFIIIITFIINLFLHKQEGAKVLWDVWLLKNITDKSIEYALFMALRLSFLVFGSSLLTLTTTPVSLTDGIESLLKPLKWIRFPVHELALIIVVDVLQIVARELAVLRDIPGATMMYTFKFAPAKGELDFDVDSSLGVVSKLFVFVNTEEVIGELELVLVVVDALFLPVFEPFHTLFAVAEEFHFHLGEFAAAESEVTGVDFVTERFTDLRDTERQLLTGAVAHLLEVHKDRLAGFGTQISGVFVVKNRTDISFHHQIEFARFGQVLAAAVGAGRGVFHLVNAVTALAIFAVGHQVAELVKVTGSLPDGGMADDGAVQTFDIVAGFHHFVPPQGFDGAFHTRTVRTVIPEAVEPAVNFRTGEDKAAPFAQRYDFFHQNIFFFSHFF